MTYLKAQLPRLKSLWPYAAALVLPGGSLIALGMWVYSRHKSGKPLFSRPAIEGFFTRRSGAASQP